MIGKYVEFFITCDECKISSDYPASEWVIDKDKELSCNYNRYEFQGLRTRAELKKVAKKEGWVIKGKKCYCPRCANKLGFAKKT